MAATVAAVLGSWSQGCIQNEEGHRNEQLHTYNLFVSHSSFLLQIPAVTAASSHRDFSLRSSSVLMVVQEAQPEYQIVMHFEIPDSWAVHHRART